MRKNSLATAVVAGIAGFAGIGGIAEAVHLNPDGLGQVLIYPYYTTQSGNDTLFTIVNTADIGKAVKVRFLEGRNSREVLDFHLYLSPFDVWSAGIVASGDGAGVLTADRSCTVPDITHELGTTSNVEDWGNGYYFVPFVNYAYAYDSFSWDGGPRGLDRTREGYLEVIEMGNLDPEEAPHEFALHGSNGEPGSCAGLNALWGYIDGTPVSGLWNDSPGWGVLPSDGRGRLFGNAMIVNAARGTVSGYPADAIDGFSFTNLHFQPGDIEPNLSHVNDPGNPFGATANVFHDGRVVSVYFSGLGSGVQYGAVDAISALYASPRVVNEYYLDSDEIAGIEFSSEWVINFPTKRFYVDTNQSLPSGGQFVAATTARAPFYRTFNTWHAGLGPNGNNYTATNGSCHDINMRLYDREERTSTTQDGFSPRPPGQARDRLCWEAQVITFNQRTRAENNEPSEILGSTYFQNIQTNYEHGWGYVEFVTAGGATPFSRAGQRVVGGVTTDESVRFGGLPVTGFFTTNAENGMSDTGVLANYSSLFRHRTERELAS